MRATPLLRISTDDTLARRAAAGDDDAFAHLYDRYRVRLEAYCRGILRHDEDARDAAQNALAGAYLALRRGCEPATFRPWLFRIAHNEAITLLRGRRPAAELPDTVPGTDRGPADAIELREELTAVLAAVRHLAPGARSALLLRELAGLEYPEVAQVLGTTPGGARQAVFEARTALQDDRAGRGTPCEDIRHELSVHDGRRRHARHIRGHLRGCTSCRDWSRAQRQRRQRLALGSIPLPFFGWIAGAFGGLAGGGGAGATLSSGLAVNSQALATMAVVAAGTTPVVIEQTRAGRSDPPARAAAAPADPASALIPSAGPVPLASTVGAPPGTAHAVSYAARAGTDAAGDGGGAGGRRSDAVERTGTRGPEGDRPAGASYQADADEDRRERRRSWDDDEDWYRDDDDDRSGRRDGRGDGDDVWVEDQRPRRERRPARADRTPAKEPAPAPAPAPEVEPEPEREPAPVKEPPPAEPDPPATTTTTTTTPPQTVTEPAAEPVDEPAAPADGAA